MYQIIDLLLNLVIGVYSSQLEVLDAWAAKCSPTFGTLDFSQLNLTGDDTIAKPAWDYRPSSFDPNFWGLRNKTCLKLKRYQVVGAAGHPIDIRCWENAIAQFETLRFRVIVRDYYVAKTLRPWFSLLDDSPKTGKKVNIRHGKRGPMFRQSLMLDDSFADDSFGLKTRHPNRERTHRSRTEIKMRGFSKPSRSWKDQGKSCRQWTKCDRVRGNALYSRHLAHVSALEEDIGPTAGETNELVPIKDTTI